MEGTCSASLESGLETQYGDSEVGAIGSRVERMNRSNSTVKSGGKPHLKRRRMKSGSGQSFGVSGFGFGVWNSGLVGFVKHRRIKPGSGQSFGVQGLEFSGV